MEKVRKNIFQTAGFAAALTWFGHHCGSGFATGRQHITYVTRHGVKGLLIPIFIWAILSIAVYFTYRISNMVKAQSYREFGNAFFGRYGKFFTTVWGVVIVITGIVSTGSMMAGGGTILQATFGGNYFVWLVLFAAFVILLVTFAGNAVSKVGSFISTPLIVILLIIIISTIVCNWDALMNVFNGTIPNESGTTWFDMGKDVYSYMGAQSGFIASACVIAISLSTASDIKIAAFGGATINMIMQIVASIAVLCGYPAVNEETLPFLTLIQTTPIAAILNIIYPVAVFLAITSTAYSICMSIVARLKKFGATKVPKEKTRVLITAAFVIVVATIMATSGLNVMIDKGYKFLGLLRMPTIVIPILLFGAWRVKVVSKKIKSDEAEDVEKIEQ